MPVPPVPVPPNQHPVVDENRHATLPWIMFWRSMQGASSGGFAPSDAEYLVGVADPSLPNERVVVNSNTNVWNLAVANQASVARAALSGDITAGFDSNVTELSTTGVTPGTYGDSTHVGRFTVDAKGRLSFASSVAIAATGTVTTTGSPASGNLTQFSGATSITNGDLSGDVSTSGTLVTTLANTAVTPGTYGDASNIPQFTVDSKGRLTFAANVSVPTPSGTVIGIDRLLGDGSTTTFYLPDLAEYVTSVTDAGLTVDPTLYALASARDSVVFSTAPTAAHVLTFSYVVATS